MTEQQDRQQDREDRVAPDLDAVCINHGGTFGGDFHEDGFPMCSEVVEGFAPDSDLCRFPMEGDEDPSSPEPAPADNDLHGRLVAAAQQVIRSWSSGNLAEAVNVLGGVLYDLDAYPEEA